jgi:hypothetical protein
LKSLKTHSVWNLLDSDKYVPSCSCKESSVLEHIVHQIWRILTVSTSINKHESGAEKLLVEDLVVWDPDINPVLPNCSLRIVWAVVINVVNLKLFKLFKSAKKYTILTFAGRMTNKLAT